MLTHLQAIEVKYHGPTDSRGSRWTATAEAGRYTMPYDYALTPADNAEKCAQGLLEKLEWDYALVGGETKNAYVFVMIPKNDKK